MADDVTLKLGGDSAGAVKASKDAGAAFKDFVTQASTYSSQLQKKLEELGGNDIIATANQYATAVEKIGGTTKLTAAEKTKLNSAVQEALEKYKALGVEAPAALHKIVTETKPAQQSAGVLDATLGKLVASFTAANLIDRGIGFLASWGKEAIETAGKTVDLANKFGLTTDTIQRMAHVQDQTGASMEGLGNAAFTLGQRVETGHKKARAAAEELGIEWSKLKNMRLDDQFALVMSKLEGVENVQDRNRIAVALFGGAAKDATQAAADGYTEVAARAKTAGDAQVRAIADAADAWSQFVKDAKTGFAAHMGTQVLVLKNWQDIRAELALLTPQELAHYRAIQRAGGDAEAFLLEHMLKRRAATEEQKKVTEEAKVVEVSYAAQLKEVTASVAALTKEQREELLAADRLGKVTEDLLDKYNLTTAGLELLKEQTNKKTEADKQAADKARQLAAEEKKRQDELFGRDVITRANQYVKELGGIENLTKLSKEQTDKLATSVTSAIATYNRLGEQAPAALQRLAAASVTALAGFEKGQRINILDLLPIDRTTPKDTLFEAGFEEKFKIDITKLLPIDKADPKAPANVLHNWSNTVTNWAENLPQQIANAFTGGGGWEGALLAAGSTLGSSSLGQIFGKSGEDGFGLLKDMDGILGQFLGSFMPAVGSLLGPALVGGFKKVFGIGVNEEVRKANLEIDQLKDRLIKTHGPLEVLEKKAQAVGLSFVENWGHQGREGLEAFEQLIADFEARFDAFMADNAARLQELEQQAADTRSEIQNLIGSGREFGYEFNEQGEFVRFNLEKVREVAQELEIDFNALGPAMEQAIIRADAEKLINQFDLLSRAGGDVGGILLGMKEEIGRLVGESIRMGTTIPENMRPWVAELIRTNQLTDENGHSIRDLSQIKFGEPVATQFETISKALLEAVNRLNEILSQIAAIPTSKTFTVTAAYQDPGPPPGFGDVDGNGVPGFARGGVLRARPGGRLARLVEGGEDEIVGPVDFMERALAGALARMSVIEASVGAPSGLGAMLGGAGGTVIQIGEVHAHGISGDPAEFARSLKDELAAELIGLVPAGVR